MPKPVQRKPESRWRCYFRRCRITVLLMVFALVGAAIYLNLVGLPDFLRRPLLEKLRDRGLDLQIATLRWHFYRGIVAEDVKLGDRDDATGPHFTAHEAELKFSYPALRRGRIEISGIGLREGRLTLPVADPNQPGRTLAIEKIRADLSLLPQDAWSLEDFHAGFGGVDFFLSGAITNASAVRDWPFFRAEKPAGDGVFRQRLRRFADALERIRFTQTPEIRVMLSGDARDLESFTLRLTLTAPDADTPWGKFADGVLTVRLRPAAPIERPQAELQLHASRVQTPWAEVEVFHPTLKLRVVASATDTNLLSANLEAQAAVVNTRWAVVTNAQFDAEWVHALTDVIPISGTGELRADSAVTRWAGAKALSLTATLATLATPPPADPELGPWQMILPYVLGWSAHASRFDTEKIGAEEIVCSGHWAAPQFEITNLLVRLPEGRLDGRARLDVNTREAGFDLKSDFDPHRAVPLLTEKAAKWLARYSWEKPPHVTGSGAIILPAWTNRQPDWRGEVSPTLRLAAFVTATNCAYLGIPADWVRTHVNYTNQVWQIPDLVASRPEGVLELAHVANDRTHEFFFGFHSTVTPEALRPLLSTNAQRGLDYFKLSSPPTVDGGVWGRWRDNSSIGFTGRVALADFAFREQTANRFESSLRYTNRFLELFEPQFERGTQTAHAAGAAVDFDARRIYFTNGFSTMEPLVITSCIGPKTTAALEPYVFRKAPTVRVNGFAPLAGNADVDLRFDVDGGPFEWGGFHIPHIAGRVHWLAGSLSLSNVQMQAYGGAGAGQAVFDLNAEAGTPFQFALNVSDVDLKALMLDVVTRSNQLEGRLDGLVVVTNANTTNFFTWNGHGHARLHDGLIWAIPVFGVLTKPLDAVVPGLGSARVSDGSATFTIIDGVMFSDTLEMRTARTRLQYSGTVDFAGQVNARVRVSPMRETLLGPLIDIALWPVTKLLEYKITGMLAEPKSEPLHIPKLFYMPLLHPFQTLEGIFNPAPADPGAQPKFSPPPPP